MRRASPEADIQIALVRLLDGMTDRFPDLKLLFAVNPNPGGNNSKAARGKAKAMGLRRGVPDLMLPVVRDRYVGYAVELKAPKTGLVSEAQWEWHLRLAHSGWLVEVHDTVQRALDGFIDYLKIEEDNTSQSLTPSYIRRAP